MQKLTVSEALEQGYKYCSPYNEEGQLIPLEKCDFKKTCVIVEKEPQPFQISDTLISDLLDDYGFLNAIAAGVLFTDITERLNEAFAKGPKYYHFTDIYLMPNKNK